MQITSLAWHIFVRRHFYSRGGRTSNYITTDAETRRKGAKIRCYSLNEIFTSARELPETVYSEARPTALSYYPCRLWFLCNSRFHINKESSEMGSTMQVRHYVTRSDTLWLPMYAPLSYSGYHRGMNRSLCVMTIKAQGMCFIFTGTFISGVISHWLFLWYKYHWRRCAAVSILVAHWQVLGLNLSHVTLNSPRLTGQHNRYIDRLQGLSFAPGCRHGIWAPSSLLFSLHCVLSLGVKSSSLESISRAKVTRDLVLQVHYFMCLFAVHMDKFT